MERSGCRSNHCRSNLGSASLGFLTDKSEEGKAQLLVSEWGEERLVKIETDGARSPLVFDCLVRDFVILPPFGDLIYVSKNSLWRVREGVSVSPIPAKESRSAHDKNWGGKTKLQPPELLFQHSQATLTGLVMLDWDHVLVSAQIQGRLLLLKVFVGEEDSSTDSEDDDLVEEPEILKDEISEIEVEADSQIHFVESKQPQEEEEEKYAMKFPKNIILYLDLSVLLDLENDDYNIGIITIDEKDNIYVPISEWGIAIVQEKRILSKLLFNEEKGCLHLAFGQDFYLYIACQTKLMRVKIKTRGKQMEKDLYKKKKF